MTIQWLGHACFKVTENGFSIVIDPYNYKFTEGYPELKTEADEVLISHNHYGHNCLQAVELSGKSADESPFTVTSFVVDHDSVGGIMRQDCKVHILEANGIRVAHMSDIGTQLNGGEISKLLNLDALMITAGSLTGLPSQEVWRLYEELLPTVLIPMHYRDGDRGSRRLEAVSELVNKFEDPSFFRYYDTDTIEINGKNEPHVAILKFMGHSIRSQFPKFHR